MSDTANPTEKKDHDELREAFEVLSKSPHTRAFRPLNWMFAGHSLALEQAEGRTPSNFVPGRMGCAKCTFELTKITLSMADGEMYAAKHQSEACPNGCGPLHAVTWEQEARSGWKANEALFDRAKAAEDALAAIQAGPLTGKYADVLRPFLSMMEAELHANTSKGDRPGWLSMTPDALLLEIYYHVSKLQKAVKNNDGPCVREHSADVANMAMMLLDACGGVYTDQQFREAQR